MAENLTYDIVYSSEIEGVSLNVEEVRSSIARRLGIASLAKKASSRYIDGLVAVNIDATEHFDEPLSKQKICAWQSAFFPNGFSDGANIEVGQYRTHEEHIVSGYFGHEKVHYVAPAPDRIEKEMESFLKWFNAESIQSSIIRSATAHLWFVSIHPFEDGNGRLARIIADICLARGDGNRFRFYNISSAINNDKKGYYEILERTQRGDGDITEWLKWYISTLSKAVENAHDRIKIVLNKAFFWINAANIAMSERQNNMLNIFLDGYPAKITSKTWSSLAKCSKDSAIRDIHDLEQKGILYKDVPDAKRPSYSINYNLNRLAVFDKFEDVQVDNFDRIFYLTGKYNGRPFKERMIALDGERYRRGDIGMESLLEKYCTYLLKENG